MACILRISGKKLNIPEFLKKSKLSPNTVYQKGEPKYTTKPFGEKNKRSGINIEVSKADFRNFTKQVKDAIKFLKKNKKEIKNLITLPGTDNEPELDFGVEQQDMIMQSNYFPSKLLLLVGKLGIGIRFSQYLCENNKKINNRNL